MININEFFIRDYIDEMLAVSGFAKQTYKSCKKISYRHQRNLENELKKQEAVDGYLEDYAIDEFIYQSVRNKTIEYIQLSNQLQGLCTLWEYRMLEFSKVSRHKQIVNKLKEDYGFNIKDDEKLNEIWLVYNTLKHGKEGESGVELNRLNSHYINESEYFAGIEENGGIQILNICEKDIEYFTGQIIRFWEIIIERLSKNKIV